MATDQLKVIIAGGGIGGLGTALALQRVGVSVTVLERATELREVGTGIGVWVNGMVALRQLGLVDEVLARGPAYHVQELRSWRGDLLVSTPVSMLARRFGVPPPIVIWRPELIDILGKALEPGVVELRAQVVGFEQDTDGVTVHLADGREVRGDVLIGADGIHSAVRMTLSPAIGPRYAGYQYLRGITEFATPLFPPGRFVFAFGRGDRFGMSHIGPGRLYWWAVIVAPEHAPDPSEGRKAEVARRFKSFMAPIPAVIQSTPGDQILRNDISDLRPLASWGVGRVTLLGDAAHATTPNLGRGAGEALEDAVTLASCLATVRRGNRAAVATVLRYYEASRMAPTARVQTTAWRLGVAASQRNPLICRARELLMRKVVGKIMVKQFEREFAEAPSLSGATR
ncbi:MAG TPA: FAD-dependent monooxygenase [Chloroflexota bacterium]|nr:FAD-dependent monooxygenase [Chloroflexota bacterium]